jgi:hypothetical protein
VNRIEKAAQESACDQFKVLSWNLLEWTEENHENPVRIACLQDEIQTWDLPNMKQDF